MKTDFLTFARELVEAMVCDRVFSEEDKTPALVLLVSLVHGPRAGLIAQDVGADIGMVGEMVENLDACGFYASLKLPPTINAMWPEMLSRPLTDKEGQEFGIYFVMDLLTAKGRITRRTDKYGEFTYLSGKWPAWYNPGPYINAGDIKTTVEKQEGEFTSKDIAFALYVKQDHQIFVVLRDLERKGKIELVRRESVNNTKWTRKVYRRVNPQQVALASR